ncbi:MAG: C10 family peptidase [Ekhidna sp.]|nr:C10 family peptidase [Ekhidna sp.]
MKQTLIFKSIAVMLIAGLSFSCEEEKESVINETDIVEAVDFDFRSSDFEVDPAEIELLSITAFNKQLNPTAPNARSSNSSLEVTEKIIIPDEQGNPAIYVVKFSEKGYIIFSATRKESPILGYSFENSFNIEALPLGMAQWFFDRMNKIQIINADQTYVIPNNVKAEWVGLESQIEEASIKARNYSSGGAWQVLAITTLEENGPFLTTLWGQWSPYNNLVPTNCENRSGRAPTGCVATAIAQVARYHAHNNVYNWAIMPPHSWSTRSVNGDREVAKLMRDIGIWVGMNYGCEGSGAKTGHAVGVFKDRLGYASGGSYETLSLEAAEPKVKSDLKDGRPVIMEGWNGYYTYTKG